MNKVHEFIQNHPVISGTVVGGVVLGLLIHGGAELTQQDAEDVMQDRVEAVKTIDHIDMGDTFVLPSGTKVRYSPTELRGNARNTMSEVPNGQSWVVTSAYTSEKNPGCIAFNVPGDNLGKQQASIEDTTKKIGWVCEVVPVSKDPTKKNVGAMFSPDGSIVIALPAEAWKDFPGGGNTRVMKSR